MHIPDGFIAPQLYLPAYGVAVGVWSHALKHLRTGLQEETIPRLAVLTAFCFVLMTVMIPLPGGTSAHATGVTILALLFGVRTTFAAVSVVLVLQALLLGAGGVTSLPVNALAMGLAGAAVARYSYRLLRSLHERGALFLAGWLSVNVPALLIAIVLGVQPVIAHGPNGQPLFFPFGLSITLPAVMLPHALVGVGEGVLTVLVIGLVRKRGWALQ